MTLNNSMLITPLLPALIAGARFQHGSVLDRKILADWVSSQWKSTVCLMSGLRGRVGLAHTQFAQATCGTIRLKLLKLAGLVRISARRIKFALASACAYADE